MNDTEIRDVWSHVVQTMSKGVIYDTLKQQVKITVDRNEYEIFCKEFVFDKLKGETFSQAFCKRFNIQDSSISIIKSDGFAKELIESLGYIK